MVSIRDWKLLLLDDEEELVSALADRLRLRGIRAETALNCEEALESMKREPPQVIVMDVLLAGTGCVGMLKQIKKDYPQTEVILMSGRVFTEREIENFFRLGAACYLQKPFKTEVLFFEILDVLKIRR